MNEKSGTPYNLNSYENVIITEDKCNLVIPKNQKEKQSSTKQPLE